MAVVDNFEEKAPLKDRMKEGVKRALGATVGRLWRYLRKGWYDLTVKLHQKTANRPRKARSKKQRTAAEIAFLTCILILPITLFLLGYVYVNLSSFALAFQKYDPETASYAWMGFDNFVNVFKDITSDVRIAPMFGRSLIVYAFSLGVGFPLNIVFAYVIYKKIPAAGFFQVVLFLPSIISSMVISLMFRYFVVYVIPELLVMLGVKGAANINLLFDLKYAFGTQIFYSLWASFGSQLILYSGAMSRIPDSIVESGKLEGISALREFWSITIPMVWQTITIFLVTGIAGIFTSQLSVFNFWGTTAPDEVQTIGYYFFVKVIPTSTEGGEANFSDYPYAAAGGMLFTLIVAPITLVGRWALERFGPNVEL